MTHEEVFKKDHQTINDNYQHLEDVKEEFGLHLELLLFAISYIREDPTLPFSEALWRADEEWIK